MKFNKTTELHEMELEDVNDKELMDFLKGSVAMDFDVFSIFPTEEERELIRKTSDHSYDDPDEFVSVWDAMRVGLKQIANNHKVADVYYRNEKPAPDQIQ